MNRDQEDNSKPITPRTATGLMGVKRRSGIPAILFVGAILAACAGAPIISMRPQGPNTVKGGL
jgi:hypothetical protein